MKLVIAIIQDRDKQRLADGLITAGRRFTKLASTGGFLREGNTTFLLAVDEDQLDDALRVIDECSKSREQYVNLLPPDAAAVGAFISNPISVKVGGATVIVLPIDRFERF